MRHFTLSLHDYKHARVKLINKTIKMTNYYKHFIYEIRKMEFVTPYIIVVNDHPPPYLKHYVKMVLDVPLDPTAYNAYYGEIKHIISIFLNFYVNCIADAEKQIEELSQNTATHDEIMQLIEKTIDYHDVSQEEFVKEFHPIESDEEQQKLDMIISDNCLFKENLLNMSVKFANKIKKRKDIDEFISYNCKKSLERTSQFCDFTHIFIGKVLADRIKHIRISLEEILFRLQRNRKDLQKEYENLSNKLYNEMYDLNKESLNIMRRRSRQSKDIAEVRKIIEGVREKIEKVGNCKIIKKLDSEIRHWSLKLKEFNKIATNLTKIKDAMNDLTAEEKKYKQHKIIELPGPKVTQWEHIADVYKKRRVALEEKYTAVSRTLITFFCCRGFDRMLHTDCMGTYYVDDFGHQNYVTDYSANVYHVDCDGKFVQKSERDKYYYDSNGRYILTKDGEKIHQLAHCTSHYKLGDDQLLQKITKDCGHSTKPNKNCKLQIKDLTDTMLFLPLAKEVDIKGTMDTETMEYLWNAFGWILPDVLYEVVKQQPKNPMHLFGHLLITKRSNMTNIEIEAKKKEALRYREDSLIQRQKLLDAKLHAWQSKQVKRCKPEGLDATAQELPYIDQLKQQQYIADVTRLCYD